MGILNDFQSFFGDFLSLNLFSKKFFVTYMDQYT